MERGAKEVQSSEIGEQIMQELHDLGQVAYVRFASVYRSFKDLNDFMKEVKTFLERREQAQKKAAVEE
jgi:transcriptional repressor NrdR